MTQTKQVVVLVAALDWGLGHAGRIVPLVRELQHQGAAVVLAGAGRSGYLLRRECPDLPYEECPPYAMNYAGKSMYTAMLRQLPKVITTIFGEHRWLRRLHQKYGFDAVISDSRFGCFHPNIYSVMVAHQLNLPLRPPILSMVVNWFYRQLLNRFDEIWVPDFPDGLSGRLSFPSPFPRTQYLGLLSRMNPSQQPPEYELLVLLSGPEPQRTRLEEIVVKQLNDELPNLPTLLVQGKTEATVRKQLPGTETTIVSYLAGMELQRAFSASRMILCRSGYSSLMDLARMAKPAILLPTPGQPEQEYLGQRCRDLGWAYLCHAQEELNLAEAIREVKRNHYRISTGEKGYTNRLEQVVADFLPALKA